MYETLRSLSDVLFFAVAGLVIFQAIRMKKKKDNDKKEDK